MDITTFPWLFLPRSNCFWIVLQASKSESVCIKKTKKCISSNIIYHAFVLKKVADELKGICKSPYFVFIHILHIVFTLLELCFLFYASIYEWSLLGLSSNVAILAFSVYIWCQTFLSPEHQGSNINSYWTLRWWDDVGLLYNKRMCLLLLLQS